MAPKVPTLYEWLGGADALTALMERFHEKAKADPLLKKMFAHLPREYTRHIAAFLGEVFGGPQLYSAQHGGHAAMVEKHMGKRITEPQRQRWMTLMLEAADEVGLPADAEFRSALVAYLEWGSRLTVASSQLPAGTRLGQAPMPAWDWGVPGGPYIPEPPPDPKKSS